MDRMCVVDGDASLHVMRVNSLAPQEGQTIRMTRSYPEIETANGTVHSTTRGDGLHSGAGNTLFREVGGRFSFGIIVGDVCAMSGDTSRGNQEKLPSPSSK